MRRISVLLRGMPAGSALGRTVGGEAALSEEAWATMVAAGRASCAAYNLANVPESQWPKAPKPPKGRRELERQQQARVEKAKRFFARHPEAMASNN